MIIARIGTIEFYLNEVAAVVIVLLKAWKMKTDVH
jgi:hypothetical protein